MNYFNYCTLLCMIILFSGCYTTKVYQKDFYSTARPVSTALYKGDFLHRTGIFVHDPHIIADTLKKGRWSFSAKPINQYKIKVNRRTVRRTVVKVQGKQVSLFSKVRLREREQELLKEIDSFMKNPE